MDSELQKEKRKEALRTVLLAYMDYKGLSQRRIAEMIGSKPANFNKRVIAGSMRSDMIIEINRVLEIDLLSMVDRYQNGESLDSIMKNADSRPIESIELELSPEEVKEVLLNAKRDQEELKEEFHQLVAQVKTWIQHDLEKSRRQEELINMLLEERAEFKKKLK
jgi:predicted XRE-type DNA-binding protein